jgi:hypothetical protein
MITALNRRIDALLLRRGFRLPEVRAVMRAELLFCAPLCVLGLCLSPLDSRLLCFAAGALLVAGNFYGLARFLQGVSLSAFSQTLLIGILARSGLRFALSALFLYGALVWLNASVWALTAGITGAVGLLAASALLWLAGSNHQKEA